MKKLFVIFLLVFCSSPAHARIVQCVVHGEVKLSVLSDAVVGSIGNATVFLKLKKNRAFGYIEELDTDLHFYGKQVVGTINNQSVHWTYVRGNIVGIQGCIYD